MKDTSMAARPAIFYNKSMELCRTEHGGRRGSDKGIRTKEKGRWRMKLLWKGLKHLVMGAAACLFALCVLAATIILLRGYRLYRDALAEKPLPEAVAALRAQPDFTPLDALPELYLDAVVAVEDHRFYMHGGIDYIAVCRALWNDLQAGAFVEGGSTITQQLAKNMYFTQEKELTRKAAELFMAWELESRYTKDEILELYVNAIYFGSGYWNIGQASRGYFGKEPAELTPYECTLLAGVPNAPNAYNPAQHAELAAQRQQRVVEKLQRYGYVSTMEAQELAMLPAT